MTDSVQKNSSLGEILGAGAFFAAALLFLLLAVVFHRAWVRLEDFWCFILWSTSASACLVSLIFAVKRVQDGCREGHSVELVRTHWDRHLMAMADAAQALYAFLKEVDRLPRCRAALRALEGLDKFEGQRAFFSLDARLGAIVYCDLRDCFLALGHRLDSLNNLEGMGLGMMMMLLLNTGLSLNSFGNRKIAQQIVSCFEELPGRDELDIEIPGRARYLRFPYFFGKGFGETELVQRFETLFYRWATLIAKADGTVSAQESAVLATIMEGRPSEDAAASEAGGISVRVSPSNWTMGLDGAPHADVAPVEEVTLERAMGKLNELIGLEAVKSEVRKLVSFIEIQRRRKKVGLKAAPISYHCVFTGNPGTGKTTVARILADIYKALGILRKGHLVETDRSGLVAEYVGQTAVKTNKIIDSALDGVLFIDEAYALAMGGENDFGREAIATLLKRMEDDRCRLVVILAGYSREMSEFIESNSGLQSRFNRYISFSDYSPNELAQIFLTYAETSQYTCSDDVKAALVQIMERSISASDNKFGNARYVRNLFERAIQRQALRLSSHAPVTNEMLMELTLHDLGFVFED